MNKISLFIKTRKKLAIIIAILAVVIFGIFLMRPTNTNTIYIVKKDSIVNTLLINGTYTTASQVPVNSPADGIITKLYVKNGDAIKKGDPLFHVESTATADQQKMAYANYQNTLSVLQAARNTKQNLDAAMWEKQQAYLTAQNAQNYKNDHTQNPVTTNDYTYLEKLTIDKAVVQTQKDFAAAEQAFKTVDTTINAAVAGVNIAQRTYEETQSVTVNAPSEGSVFNLQKNVGDQIQSVQTETATQTQLAQTSTIIPPILIISDLSNPVITASVDQVNIPRMKLDQKAAIIFDALPNQTFAGYVKSLDVIGTKTQGTTTYNVTLGVNDVSQDIKPNMTASITIEVVRKENILTVPNDAITHKEDRNFVQVANTSNSSLQEVVIGLKGLTTTEVISGLSIGDKIVVPK